MAKFIKFNIIEMAAGPHAGPSEEILIPIDKIVAVTDVIAGPEQKTTITLSSSATAKWVIVSDLPLAGVGATTNATQRAMTANPGGIVSTVGSPIKVAQVVVPTNSGRQLITVAQEYTPYINATFTA